MLVRQRTIAATTTIEVIQEFAHVRSQRRSRIEAVTAARDFMTILSPLIVVDNDLLTSGLDLFELNPRLGAFDCVLAAAALAEHSTALVSADKGFSSVPGLTHYNPRAGAGGLTLLDS